MRHYHWKAINVGRDLIMVTAVTETSIAYQCMKGRAYDYITKPFNPDRVTLSTDRALEKRRLVIENSDYQRHLEQRVREQAQKIRGSFSMP